jgi:hypothetical protein
LTGADHQARPAGKAGEVTDTEMATPNIHGDGSKAPVAAVSAAPPPGPELPIYDPAAFDDVAAFLMPAVITGHIETVIKRSERLLRELRASFAMPFPLGDARSTALAKSAHTLGGSAGMFGYQRLAVAAYGCQHAFETNAPETSARVATLIAAIEASLPRMRGHSPAAGEVPRAEVGTSTGNAKHR